MKCPKLPRALLSAPLAIGALVAPSRATWSVVVLDTSTGEVCVASATCIASFNLKTYLPVVVTPIGCAAAQSLVDFAGINKLKIWNGLLTGDSPFEILGTLAHSDGAHQQRQYGIVNMLDAPVTFSGTGAGAYKEGVIGQVGQLKYAIQGNVLYSKQVIYAAESALLGTSGDLGQRVMAAMEAARLQGGDGRCSCNSAQPASCQPPPPPGAKSAHCGFIVLARVGDVLGSCSSVGCAKGVYYLDFNVAGPDSEAGDPDPVLQLEAQYATWRAQHAGHADHIKTLVSPSAQALVADGTDALTVTVKLVDLDGVFLDQGGAALSVVQSSGPAGLATIGPVSDLGDGSYAFQLGAGTTPGTGAYTVKVDDGTYKVQLHPPLELRVDPLVELHCGFDEVSASAPVAVPFAINLGAVHAGEPYLTLASASGTAPGVTLASGSFLPLNPDVFTLYTLKAGDLSFFPGGSGALDANGHAPASLNVDPGGLSALVGQRLDFAVVVRLSPPVISNAAGFDIGP